ncbi:MAG: alpha-amylase [Planctomycetota bacterium]|jgi:alpha-amylase|nr:MAG: alpha-amylase [Planctomycetota bacterium]RLS94225.1 MAG: alpha-amylase [Planctomycetota bacterium]
MASVCFYFQLHQPWRLRRYSVFANDPFYFDDAANEQILRKVADKCYRPTTLKMLDLVKRHDRRFRCSYSITCTALEQLQRWAPDVVDTLKELVDTGACELIGETSHHSPSFLFSKKEFDAQVTVHQQKMQEVFGVVPKIFRNTELIYSNELAHHIAARGQHKAIICEGVDRLLGFRSPNYIYVPPASETDSGPIEDRRVKLLLKNYRLSDDIAFRFSNRAWKEWPLSAERFAEWVNQINGDGFTCNLFMDYETFGEHQWADTGIFQFLDALPKAVYDINPGHNQFLTPSQVLECSDPVGEYDAPNWTSWADTERDLSAWLGNPLQDNAAAELYRLEEPVRERHAAGDPYILEDWRKLTTSDHLYYMCTKYWADGDVHKYFSPYNSPYDAYINFMNVLDNLKIRAGA